MEIIMFGSIIGTGATLLVGIVVGAVASYLVLRNNPKIKAKLDDKVEKL